MSIASSSSAPRSAEVDTERGELAGEMSGADAENHAPADRASSVANAFAVWSGWR